jgi:hypothetical protein
MRAKAAYFVVALAVLLAACGGSSPEASKTETAQPSAAVAQVSPTTALLPAAPASTTSPPPLAGPTTSLSPQTSKQPSTTPKVLRATTAAWAPSSPQPTASQAASVLIDAWAASDRASALEDATPAAVSALFATAYPEAGLQFRGCSTPPGHTASSCVYRDGDNLLSLTVSPLSRGWAVTAAVQEN